MKSLLNSTREITRGNIFKQGSIVLFDQGFLSIANFATGILVARACTKEEYGNYVLVWSLLLILTSIHRAMVQVPLTVYLPRLKDHEQNIYQGSAFVHTLLIGIIFSGALLFLTLFSKPFENAVPQEFLSVIALLALLVAPLLLREFIRNALFARLYFSSSLIANFAATVTQLCLILLLFITSNLSLTSALLAIIAGSVLAAGFMLWTHKDDQPASNR